MIQKTKIISGNSNQQLASKIADRLNLPLCDAEISRFNDGEVKVEINESVRGFDVFVIQSTSNPANENLMELLLMIDALVRSNVNYINVLIPYYGYSRQDRRPDFSRTPVSSRLIADMLEAAGANEIITVDIHSQQQQGFFHVPTTNVSASPVFLEDIKRVYENSNDVVFVSPDVGGVGRTRSIAKHFNDADLAIIDKRRPKAGFSEVMNIIGDVDNKHCILIDDIVDTAGTLCRAAESLKNQGAKSVTAYCTHAVLSGNGTYEKINNSHLDTIVVTNTIYHDHHLPRKIRTVDLSHILSETLRRIESRESVSRMYT